MDANNAMYELLEFKQEAFNASLCDFAVNHDMEKIARTIGMDGQVLRNMMNPSQSRHLTCPVMALVCYVSDDYSIVNTLLGDLGVVTASVPVEEQAKSLVERILEHSNLTGQLSGSVLALSHEHRYPRSQKRKTLATAQAALGNLVLLISDLEKRTTGVSPLLSMGVDFVMNGAAIPGLA
ncbi:phage regulatory CII family protein [Vibrio sp. V08_P9A1T1]|uniref:phage regulatory CII family protein n=1 Tax=Vibrio sp. V08_P9A1T1 TaxID=1938663 RepID=UPI000B8E5D4C|nr:phage regulatory CII family protein [Vibrio sp. V08_P9A1T1]OXX29098.1 transcriptional regulator [Vibrio sp. V08_P9A1T1]